MFDLKIVRNSSDAYAKKPSHLLSAIDGSKLVLEKELDQALDDALSSSLQEVSSLEED